MRSKIQRATLTISIDLDAGATGLGLSGQRSVEGVTARLLGLLARHQLPATWAIADPAASSLTGQIVGSGEHEIALWGDRSWVGDEAGRGCFARELLRRAGRGRAAGLSISTMVLTGTEIGAHADLAIKHGIKAVRSTGTVARRGGDAAPQTMRYGLLSVPVSASLPGTSRWLPGGGGGHAARAGINQAIKQGRLFQLAIAAHELVARGSAAERVLRSVLAHAAARRRAGLLEILTIGSAAASLSNQGPRKPSQSILHSAA